MRKTDFFCIVISFRDFNKESSVKARSALSHRERETASADKGCSWFGGSEYSE